MTSLTNVCSIVYRRQKFWTWQELVSMVRMGWSLLESGTLPGGIAVKTSGEAVPYS